MRLRHLAVRRFRGIRTLDWSINGSFVCLVGAGDATKSTILEAIGFVLSPRWSITLDDADFYNGDTSEPLLVEATIGQVPDEFKSDAKYGLHVRGWSPAGTLHDEPDGVDEIVISIRLRVDASLEPSWTVFNDRDPDGRRISAADRARLGCVRLGSFLDREFSWARGSVLSRLSGEGDKLGSLLAEAGRAAKLALGGMSRERLPALFQGADEASVAGKELGVQPRKEYRPELDTSSVTVAQGAISLHDGPVPIRRLGMGTRRLLAIAMQRSAKARGSLTLIDEVELGLEPHRLRHLLQVLQGLGKKQPKHALATTHSPIAIEELSAESLRIVRCSPDGATTVAAVPADLQGAIRSAPSALLSRRILVCEGPTEVGLCRSLDRMWSQEGVSFALLGVSPVDGGGSSAPARARDFRTLGYPVALLADSDAAMSPPVDGLAAGGVTIIQWEGECCTEHRVVMDLPWAGVEKLVETAAEGIGLISVRDAVTARLEDPHLKLSDDPTRWTADVDEQHLRVAIASAAAKNGWFKRIAHAEAMGDVVVTHRRGLAGTALGRQLRTLKEWAHKSA